MSYDATVHYGRRSFKKPVSILPIFPGIIPDQEKKKNSRWIAGDNMAVVVVGPISTACDDRIFRQSVYVSQLRDSL